MIDTRLMSFITFTTYKCNVSEDMITFYRVFPKGKGIYLDSQVDKYKGR